MFPTVNIDCYWSRDNVWLVVSINNGRFTWIAARETKADAVEEAQSWFAGLPEDKRPDAVWVMKSPHFISCE